MRKYLLIGLGVLVLGSSGYYFYSMSDIFWKTYTNTEYRFQVKYPSGWYLQEAGKIIIIDDFASDYEGPNKDAVVVVVGAPNRTGTTQWSQTSSGDYGRFQDIKPGSIWARTQVSNSSKEKIADQIIASISVTE